MNENKIRHNAIESIRVMDVRVAANLAAQIEDFLAVNDLAYGYAEAVNGWESQQNAVKSITKMLTTGNTDWLEVAFNGLLREKPELTKQVYTLRSEVFNALPIDSAQIKKFMEDQCPLNSELELEP